MATTPKYADSAAIGMGQVSTANTARDGTGTIATIYTAPANGAVVKRVRVVATGTTTAGMVRLFLHDGTNTRLLAELDVPAVTVSATQAAHVNEFVFDDLVLPSNSWSVRAATHNAETFNVFAFAGEFT